jgi:predicted nucleic acid-binding protein
MTSSTRASEFVTDTMGLVLRIEQRRLPPPVKAIFDAVESGNATVYVPAMVFAEILYLAEKHRISLSLRTVAEHLVQPGRNNTPIRHGAVSAHRSIERVWPS